MWVVGRALLGPVVIVSAVLVCFASIGVLSGDVTSQHPDLLALWLPNHCFLGRSLAAADIPAWNPYAMAGAPFVADPQSGWMNLTAMGLYSRFSCATALPLYIALQPILAGLGLYGFLRSEGLRRVGATVGGAWLAVAIARSRLGISLAFSGTVAWTAVLLWCTSRYLQAETRRSRVLWLGAAAISWGQIAAIHPSHGLLIGTAAVVTLACSHVFRRARGERSSTLRSLAILGAAAVFVNLAVILPRLAYFGRTSLALGYGELQPDRAIGGLEFSDLAALLLPGGVFLGPLALICLLRARRSSLVIAMGVFTLGAILLSLHSVADVLKDLVGGVPGGDFYIHDPARLSIGALIGIAVLIGAGASRLFSEDRGILELLSVRGLLLGCLTAEIAIGAAPLKSPSPDRSVVQATWFDPLTDSFLPIDEYMTPPPVVPELGHTGRYITVENGSNWRGSLPRQAPDDLGFMANQRAMLFHLGGVEATTAPVQPIRYWKIVRAFADRDMKYNASEIDPGAAVLCDLFDVRYAIFEDERYAGEPGAGEGGRQLRLRLLSDSTNVQLFDHWRGVESSAQALALVTAPGFDPSDTAIVEGVPSQRDDSGDEASSATLESSGTQELEIDVDAGRTSLLVIRMSFDPGWKATIDGTPVEVVPADYAILGVRVPPGSHRVRLVYSDPTIGAGLIGSGLSLLVLLLIAGFPSPTPAVARIPVIVGARRRAPSSA